MSGRAALASFILLAVGGGLLIGVFTAPGAWYQALAKPSFNPPNWLFGPVWTVLYVMIAIAGWRAWQADRSGAAMKFWWLQLLLNFLWSPVFFSMQSIGGALAVILSLLLAIAAFIVTAWNRDRLAAWLFVPYLAWVAFASMLNGAIWALN